MTELILASTSVWRRQMLEAAGIPCRGVAPGVDERALGIKEPVALVRELARRKALAVAERYPRALVLGADQMVFDGEELFGKPANPEDHLRRLRGMRGQSHRLVTGICLLGPGVERVEHEVTSLRVRADLEESEIEAYVAQGEGRGCAGGYTIEGHGVFLFDDIDGDWFNIVGLPIRRVIGLLRELGWRYPWPGR